MQQISVNGNTYNLVSMPSTPGPASIVLGYQDTVATVESPFTKQTQVQTWPGADWWTMSITMPPMTRAQAWPWEAFLAELRGQQNVFQIGDPRALTPLGTVTGTPVAASAESPTGNAAMATTLGVRGFNATDSLLAGDYIQVGYRLYRVVESTGPISSGAANLVIWPSLREQVADNTSIITNAPQGLFRLASNPRQIQSSPLRLTTMSFNAVEVR
jgi:hypothetical protein